MTREQAEEIWKDMYIYEVISEYNHYVSDVMNFSDEEIFDMDDIDYLIEDIPPMDLIKMVVYGDVRLTDEYFTFDGYGNMQTISKDDLFDFIIDRIDEEHLIAVAKEYEEDEEDDQGKDRRVNQKSWTP